MCRNLDQTLRCSGEVRWLRQTLKSHCVAISLHMVHYESEAGEGHTLLRDLRKQQDRDDTSFE